MDTVHFLSFYHIPLIDMQQKLIIQQQTMIVHVILANKINNRVKRTQQLSNFQHTRRLKTRECPFLHIMIPMNSQLFRSSVQSFSAVAHNLLFIYLLCVNFLLFGLNNNKESNGQVPIFQRKIYIFELIFVYHLNINTFIDNFNYKFVRNFTKKE